MKSILLTILASVAVAAPTENKRLISLKEGEAKWMTEGELLALFKTTKHLHFVDVTDGAWDTLANHVSDSFAEPVFPTAATKQAIVRPMLAKIDRDYIRSFLTKFTSFRNRYYQSSFGVQSAQYLYDELVGIQRNMTRTDLKLTVTKVAHTWKQFSVVARLEVASPTAGYSDLVILGAHQDSINSNDPMNGIAPGVDDDASGVVNNLSTLKLLIGSPDFVPLRPIEFQFYAAEEVGLRGSQKIASDYVTKGVPVYGMLQSDMTGYAGTTPSIALVTDFVNPALTQTVRVVAREYSTLPVVDTRCGYGCSDHASWNRAGIPSAFHFEAKFNADNPNIHTARDTFQFVSIDHMVAFIKTTVGFAVEMSLFQQ
jgi:leucyl aminopeptidase